MDRILNEARSMGCMFIVFSGGEPLTRRKELFRLIEKYSDMYFMFYTNRTLIDDAVADELYRLGNAGAVMSLEGFEEATDARRGRGVFNKVMAAMDRLRERGVPFGTSLTVTSRNVQYLTGDDFFGHLSQKGVMVCWFFLFMPVGKDPDVSLMPSPVQREYLRKRGQVLRREYPIFIADFWNDAPYVGGCIAGGRNYIHINANGDVEPWVFTNLAVGKIFLKNLFVFFVRGFL
jgi:MoaA/NifB/PqqE/SkfB family radical SAM enzyme